MTNDEGLEQFINSKISKEHREIFERDITLLKSGWNAAIKFKETNDTGRVDQYRS